jgi:DNA-directed RNA polymerase specialized sigma24 family protein
MREPLPEDAEDGLLDGFLAALERESLRALSKQEQRHWLWRVARNKMVDYYRRTARRPQVPLEEVTETLFADDERTRICGFARGGVQRSL